MQTVMVLSSTHEESFNPLCGEAGEVRPLHVYDQKLILFSQKYSGLK